MTISWPTVQMIGLLLLASSFVPPFDPRQAMTAGIMALVASIRLYNLHKKDS